MTRPEIIKHNKTHGYKIRPLMVNLYYPLINGVGKWGKEGATFTINGTVILAKKNAFRAKIDTTDYPKWVQGCLMEIAQNYEDLL